MRGDGEKSTERESKNMMLLNEKKMATMVVVHGDFTCLMCLDVVS